jgi:hypothetical protein
VDAALAGELDEKRLNALLLDYATVTPPTIIATNCGNAAKNCSSDSSTGRCAAAVPRKFYLRCDHTSNRPLNRSQRPAT